MFIFRYSIYIKINMPSEIPGENTDTPALFRDPKVEL